MRRLPLPRRLAAGRAELRNMASLHTAGRVNAVNSLAARVLGLSHHVCVGDRLVLTGGAGREIAGEVVSIQAGAAHVLTFDTLEGLGMGSPVRRLPHRGGLHVDDSWLGRVIDPLGRPLDGMGALPPGPRERPAQASPPPATARARLGPRLDLGVRALDLFTPCREGQRLGLFAGSGIGKSTLLAMLARQARCDVVVLALVGERGREVREFLEDDLGPEGRARAVTVVATSDTPPLMRRQAGFAAMAVAEHFRDQGKSVLLLLDSVTRFCLALREIALAAGEPPATRGYPASVFAALPRLLERAGPGARVAEGGAGQITGLFTVLVEGDDHNEPVADAVRGILDGHVILDRAIAEAGRYPPVDVLRSVSRSAPGCLTEDEALLVRRARAILAQYANMADLVRLGAYQHGSDPAVDEALVLAPRIEALLTQNKGEPVAPTGPFPALAEALGTARA